jgi:hypothetical protein
MSSSTATPALRCATAAPAPPPPLAWPADPGQVAAGLDYAHRKTDVQGRPLAIVHCDVSPQNIMLSREGFVKILDFGVARARFGISHRDRRLRGKPRYMSPEQARGEVPGPDADVFALGILAWEACAGRRADGADLQAILAAVRRAEVKPLEQAAPSVPEELAAAVNRALRAAPAERGSAADLGAALHMAARSLGGGGSRAMADWLDRLYPPPEDPTGITAVEVPAAPPHPEHGHDATTLVTRVEDIDDLPAPPPAALTEKRRVVVVALLADGPEAARAGLTHLLADLAYKHAAVVHEQDADAWRWCSALEAGDNPACALAPGAPPMWARGAYGGVRCASHRQSAAARGRHHPHGDVEEARAPSRCRRRRRRAAPTG